MRLGHLCLLAALACRLASAASAVRVWQGALPNFDAAAWSARLESARVLIEAALLLPDRNLAHHIGHEALRHTATNLP